MKTLGNVLWHFPFFGFISASIVYLLGLLFTATVIAAPIGLGLMEFGKFLFSPFGHAMISKSDLNIQQNKSWKLYSTFIMILYFPVGIFLALAGLFQVFGLCLSIVGIPVAMVVVKSLGTYLNPVNKKCVAVAVATELEKRKGQAEVEKYLGAGTAKPIAPQVTAPASVEGVTKDCPRCAETVKAAAKICRHCGHEFMGPVAPSEETAGKAQASLSPAAAIRETLTPEVSSATDDPAKLNPQVLIGGRVVVAILLIGGIWYATKKNPEPVAVVPTVPVATAVTVPPAPLQTKLKHADYAVMQSFNQIVKQTSSVDAKLASIDNLIKNGFNLNSETEDSDTPIRILMDLGASELVEPLVSRGLSTNPAIRGCGDQYWYTQVGPTSSKGMEVLAALVKAGFKEDCLRSREGSSYGGFVCGVMSGSAMDFYNVSVAVRAVDELASMGFDVGATCGGQTVVQEIETVTDPVRRLRLTPVADAIKRHTLIDADSTKSAGVLEGLASASIVKVTMVEYFNAYGKFPPNQEAAGLAPAAAFASNTVRSVTVMPNTGIINITYNANVIDGGVLTLSPSVGAGGVSYKCKKSGAALKDSWLPAACR